MADPTLGRFADRCAFITGGAAGMGREFGRAFAAEGAAVAIADIDVEGAKRAAAELEAAGHAALAIECDVADEQSVDNAVGIAVDRFGGIDILVNNAALHLLKYNQPFSVLPRADLREMLDVNVVGVVNCSVACRSSMQARGGGVIVSIASVSGHMSETPYGVSKLAVRGITVALAKEFAPDRIRVNAISPGLMASENAMAELPADLVEHVVENMQWVHELGSPDDIVQALLFLCSDAARMITGETLKVTGGGYPLNL